MKEDLLAGASAAASYVGVKPRAIYHMTKTGRLPVVRMGRNLFYRKSELESAFQSASAPSA